MPPATRADHAGWQSDGWASRLVFVADSPRERDRLGDAEHSLHSGRRVPGHLAKVRVAASLVEGHSQLRRLARVDDRRALAGDREVVPDVADVREDERDLAELRGLRRELEEELAAFHFYGRGGLGFAR